jgi:uncharacterized protein (DUF58 family)
LRSGRRGFGSDVVGSRQYRPGDTVHAIDWGASARLSAATGLDEFVVRERFAEEAPRVILLLDRRPAMALYPAPWPWLDKAAAQHTAARLVVESGLRSHGLVGAFELGGDGPRWIAPQARAGRWQLDAGPLADARFDARESGVSALEHLWAWHRRAVPPGSFVFVCSDFLAPPPDALWLLALEQRWDVVPVVIQDPVWEASFPDISGVTVPFSDPRTGEIAEVRLSRREARERRRANEERRETLVGRLARLGLDPVLVSSADPQDVLGAFTAWAELRQFAEAGRS